jgi:hypothetical protein
MVVVQRLEQIVDAEGGDGGERNREFAHVWMRGQRSVTYRSRTISVQSG